MNEEIVITVVAKPGHGKSTLAQLIAEALHEKGIEARVNDEPDGDTYSAYNHKRLQAIKNSGKRILIQTIQMPNRKTVRIG